MNRSHPTSNPETTIRLGHRTYGKRWQGRVLLVTPREGGDAPADEGQTNPPLYVLDLTSGEGHRLRRSRQKRAPATTLPWHALPRSHQAVRQLEAHERYAIWLASDSPHFGDLLILSQAPPGHLERDADFLADLHREALEARRAEELGGVLQGALDYLGIARAVVQVTESMEWRVAWRNDGETEGSPKGHYETGPEGLASVLPPIPNVLGRSDGNERAHRGEPHTVLCDDVLPPYFIEWAPAGEEVLPEGRGRVEGLFHLALRLLDELHTPQELPEVPVTLETVEAARIGAFVVEARSLRIASANATGRKIARRAAVARDADLTAMMTALLPAPERQLRQMRHKLETHGEWTQDSDLLVEPLPGYEQKGTLHARVIEPGEKNEPQILISLIPHRPVEHLPEQEAEEEGPWVQATRDAPGAAALVSRTGTIEAWNRGAEALLGWNEEKVLGQPIALLDPSEGPALSEALKEDGATPVGQSIERMLRTRDGQEVPLRASATPLTDRSGETRNLLLTFSEPRRTREQERTYEEQARVRILAKIGEDFLTSTHHITNPLSAALNLAYVMRHAGSQGAADTGQDLDLVIREIERAAKQIKEVSQASQDLPEPWKVVPGDQVIRRMAERMDSETRQTGIRVILDVGSELPELEVPLYRLEDALEGVAQAVTRRLAQQPGQGHRLLLISKTSPETLSIQVQGQPGPNECAFEPEREANASDDIEEARTTLLYLGGDLEVNTDGLSATIHLPAL